MAKRKLDEEDSVIVETKEPAVKRLKLDSLESARGKVFNNPDLPHVIGSFLSLKDYTKFGSSYKNGHSQLIKSERGAKFKEKHTCITCKSRFPYWPLKSLVEKTGRFKPGRYCWSCFPTKCDGWNCRRVERYQDMQESAGEDGLFCDDCEPGSDASDGSEKEEEEEEDPDRCSACGEDCGVGMLLAGLCHKCYP
jgi:hypothetical protein